MIERMFDVETTAHAELDYEEPSDYMVDESYVGPYGVADWRAPLSDWERRAGVVEPGQPPNEEVTKR